LQSNLNRLKGSKNLNKISHDERKNLNDKYGVNDTKLHEQYKDSPKKMEKDLGIRASEKLTKTGKIRILKPSSQLKYKPRS
jgi:hypothetical protein